MVDSVTPVGVQAEHKRDVIFEVAAGRDTGERIAAHVRMVQPAGSRDVTIIADEGAHRGGGDSAPNALAYFSAALMLSQLSRYGTVHKLRVDDVQMAVTTRFHIEGSVLATRSGRGPWSLTRASRSSRPSLQPDRPHGVHRRAELLRAAVAAAAGPCQPRCHPEQ